MKNLKKNRTAARLLAMMLCVGMLCASTGCGNAANNGTESDTTLKSDTTGSTDSAETTETTATSESTAVTEAVSKEYEMIAAVPFDGLESGESMLEWNYRWMESGTGQYVLRYGVFSSAAEGILGGKGMYLDLLSPNADGETFARITFQRHDGVGFIALNPRTSVAGTALDCVVTYSLSLSGQVFTGSGYDFYGTHDAEGWDTFSFAVFSGTTSFTLDRYGERKFMEFFSNSSEMLVKEVGSQILVYHDGTDAKLTDTETRLLGEETISALETATMAQVAEVFGVEYKG